MVFVLKNTAQNKMKNLYIHGSFMNDNYGDFLLFNSVFNVCKKYDKDYNIYASDVSDFYEKFLDFKKMPRKKAINNADVVVLAGGGYFGEPPKIKFLWNIRFWCIHAWPIYRAIKKKLPVCIVGVGVGPLSFGFSRKITKKIFDKAEVVCVRDQESKEFLTKCGVRNTIFCYPDWILGSSREDLLMDEFYAEGDIEDKIVIHLTTKCNSAECQMYKVISDIRKICHDYNKQVVIITDQGRETQKVRAEKVKSVLGEDSIPIYYYKNPYELTYIIHKAKLVITDKLHVGIVATRFCIPVISVAAHTKTLRFYKQIGREYASILLKDVNDGTVYNIYKQVINEEVKIDEFVKEADNNRKELEDFLRRNRL